MDSGVSGVLIGALSQRPLIILSSPMRRPAVKMATNIGRRFLLLAALVLAANDAAAQAPVQSFADLQPLVKPGQQVIVWGDDGRKTTGRVVSLAGNQLEIRRQRRFRFRQERLVLTEGSVGRIEHRDSTWNGALLGAGVGVLMTVLVCKTENYYSADPLLRSCLLWISLGPLGGGLVGGAIDGAINRPLYVSAGGSRITLLPLLGRQRAGLAAAIRF